MQATDGWRIPPTILQQAIYSMKQEIDRSYSVFTDNGAAVLGHEFESMYNENMERRPNDAV